MAEKVSLSSIPSKSFLKHEISQNPGNSETLWDFMRLAKKYFHLKSNAVYNSSAKNWINLWTNQNNSILSGDLWFVDTPPPLGGWMGGLMDGLCQMTKSQIILDIIEIIQFCLKIYDLWRHPLLWVGVWVVGWMEGSIGEVRSNH